MTESDRQTRLCRNCYEPIDVRARVCPHCRRETRAGVKHAIKGELLTCLLTLLLAPIAAFVVFLALMWAFDSVLRSFHESPRPAVRRSAPPAKNQPPGRVPR